MSKDVNWNGKTVANSIRRYAASALNEVGGEAVRYAKSNHGGWENRTGTAEGSIQVVKTAEPGSRKPFLLWGSKAVVYMKRLEFEHGSALRTAASVTYPKLVDTMKRRMK